MKPVKVIMIIVIQMFLMNYAVAQNNQSEKPFESAVHPDFVQKSENNKHEESKKTNSSENKMTPLQKKGAAAAFLIGAAVITEAVLIYKLNSVLENSRKKTWHITI